MNFPPLQDRDPQSDDSGKTDHNSDQNNGETDENNGETDEIPSRYRHRLEASTVGVCAGSHNSPIRNPTIAARPMLAMIAIALSAFRYFSPS